MLCYQAGEREHVHVNAVRSSWTVCGLYLKQMHALARCMAALPCAGAAQCRESHAFKACAQLRIVAAITASLMHIVAAFIAPSYPGINARKRVLHSRSICCAHVVLRAAPTPLANEFKVLEVA